jgi:3'-phosphoadenosine 5'-phosphosulfate sulfotransferase (PAPS reductase)/FAD synthetase
MKTLFIPPVISQALEMGAVTAVSISGGKDSQALTAMLTRLGRERGLIDRFFALHMDLGRAEWKETPAVVERHAARYGLPLVVTRRPQGDLVQEITDRMHKLKGTGKPFWPSADARYCTSDHKRSQADRVYRNLPEHTPFWPSVATNLIISAEGNRAQESTKREKDEVVSIRKQVTAAPLRDLAPAEALAIWQAVNQLLEQGDIGALRDQFPDFSYCANRNGITPPRLAFTWYAIHDWEIEDVWIACDTSAAEIAHRRNLYRQGHKEESLAGWPCHPAYVYGNSRLSCALCMLASHSDIRNGAHHNPKLAQIYLELEAAGGFRFKNDKSLAEILTGDDDKQLHLSI